MNNPKGNLDDIASNMQQLRENVNGTLSGGFLSVNSRNINYDNPHGDGYAVNKTAAGCSGTNIACINQAECKNSTNKRDEGHATCSNTSCIQVVHNFLSS